MLYLRGFDQLGLVIVTGDAERLHISLRQDYLAVFRRCMAHVTGFVRKRRMEEFRHQLWCGGLVGIVTTHAVRGAKGLVAMGGLQICRFRIVTINAQCRNRFGEVEIEFLLALVSYLVDGVAGVASHIERGVTASPRRNIRALLMAAEAEVFLGIGARGGLQKLVLVI